MRSRVLKMMMIGLILLTAGACSQGPARTTRTHDYYGMRLAEITFSFAEQYYERAQYRQAIGKYQEYLDYYGDLYRADECQFRIAECFDHLGEIPQAGTAYHLVAQNYPESEQAAEALLRAGKRYESVYFMEDAYNLYRKCVDNYRYTPQATESQERAAFIAKTYLDMPVNFAWPSRGIPPNPTPENAPNPQPSLLN